MNRAFGPACAILRTLSVDSCKQTSWILSASKRHYHDNYLAVCIERVPVKTCEMSELEQKYYKMLEDIEYENSGKSDFELREEQESKSKIPIVSDSKSNFMSIKDFKEYRIKELENLKTLLKSEEEKTDRIITSTKRKSSESIFLVTKQKQFGSQQEAWLPPQDVMGKDETVKSAAKRIVQNVLGDASKVVFYGNAPFKFNEYKFTSEENGVKKIQKQKVFYYSVKYVSGPALKKDIPHQWLSIDELEKIIPDSVYKSMKNSLLMCK